MLSDETKREIEAAARAYAMQGLAHNGYSGFVAGATEWAERAERDYRRYIVGEAEREALVEAARGVIEQIEAEIGPCDGTVDSRLYPSANDLRAALAPYRGRREKAEA